MSSSSPAESLIRYPIAVLASVEGAPLCLVTYHPAQLAPTSVEEMDLAVALPRGAGAEWQGTLAAAGFPAKNVQFTADAGDERRDMAIMFDHRSARAFTVDRRVSSHVRHWHKYANAMLPSHRRFYFRHGPHLTGATAANMGEFHEQLARCAPDVLRHHAGHGDFSRWIGGVIQDQELARGVHEVETMLAEGREDVERARQTLLRTVEARSEASGASAP